MRISISKDQIDYEKKAQDARGFAVGPERTFFGPMHAKLMLFLHAELIQELLEAKAVVKSCT